MTEQKKILIVDDQDVFVKMIKNHLETLGYGVTSARNGNDGLEKAKEGKPDLLLLDIMMPEKDGYTMLLELKKIEETKNIPVIIVTAKGSMKDLFGLAGVHDYLVKPFDFKELLEKIKKYI